MVQTNDAEIVSMGVDYLTVICVFGFGQMFQLIFEKILQSTGRTSYTMIMQMVGAIINIILDPIFIFGYFGLPAMGTKGAAIATVTGQIIAMLLGLYFNLTKNKDVQFNFKSIELESYYFRGFVLLVFRQLLCSQCQASCVLELISFFLISQLHQLQCLVHILNYRHLCIWQFWIK